MNPRLTVAGIAAWLGCTDEHVLGLIADGDLEAIDIRRKGTSRPRWIIAEEALQRFIASRSSLTGRPAPRPKLRLRKLPRVGKHV